MRPIDLNALAAELLPIAQRAGEAIMQVFRAGNAQVRHKADHSPVTQADRAANGIIVQGLAPLLDGCLVVSEEDEASHAWRSADARFWLVDPLDGTREFISGSTDFTVNIALIEAGRSILGVVLAPASGALYWGGPGLGAFRIVGADTTTIRVGAGDDPATIRVVASRSHLNGATRAFMQRLGPSHLVQAGSSLKFCRVAEGAADIYPRMGPTCEWDTAAAQAVLEGAGGVVLDLQRQPLRYGKPQVLNPSFVAARAAALIPMAEGT